MVRPRLILVACLASGCFDPGTQPADDAGGVAGADAGGAGTGGAGTGGDAGSPVACSVDSECGWGEIDHEILTAADCICLFGCPFLALNLETIDRRLQQHETLCNPQFDGKGQPCPIDDCAMPAPAVCLAGSCGGQPFGGP